MGYDVLLLHPPAFPDVRERPRFLGPVARTVEEGSGQFAIPPIGLLSIADYLDRNGYRVLVDNLAERVSLDPSFDLRDHLRREEAAVCGVDLHWILHAYGALAIARLCKELHPSSLVVMGGLTATIFHMEIIEKYSYVDAVLRGEAEAPFLELMDALEGGRPLDGVPNITMRTRGGRIVVGRLMAPPPDLDPFEFTRLDLLRPGTLLLSGGTPSSSPHWQLPVARGCPFNCRACGGSSYTYSSYFGRSRPAFRSPRRLAEDLSRLRERGIRVVFLFQDPRIGGRKYWEELFAVLRREGAALDHVTLELFWPADEEYFMSISRIPTSVSLTISPESGSERVRAAHGRGYSNAQLLRTVELSQKYRTPLLVFFMVALGHEDRDTIRETWDLWERILETAEEAGGGRGRSVVGFGFGPMVMLDPGSPAFDRPEEYGYRVIHRTLEEHVNALSMPSWHQWFNYENESLSSRAIAELALDSIERAAHVRERHGIYDRLTALVERLQLKVVRLAMEEVDKILEKGGGWEELRELHSELRRRFRLRSL